MSRDRRWLEIRVAAAGDVLSALVPDALVELGARGVVEDGGRHVAYFEEPDDPDAFAAEAREHLEGMSGEGAVTLEWRWQEHEQWSEAWKRGLGPRRITPRLVVHPSWKPPRELRPGDLVVVLDPGMAFGTAEHGTTRGCIRFMDGLVQEGDRILDVGAGSGILSVVAARLGADEVLAVEGDPLACEAMEDNVRRNGVSRRVEIRTVWADAGTLASWGTFDGVLANIETGLLLPLIPGLGGAVKPGGWLLLSGILEDEMGRIAAAADEVGFTAAAEDADGEWRSVLLRRS